jgi:hypothetical protein
VVESRNHSPLHPGLNPTCDNFTLSELIVDLALCQLIVQNPTCDNFTLSELIVDLALCQLIVQDTSNLTLTNLTLT